MHVSFGVQVSIEEARNLIYNYLFLTLDVDEIRAQAWDNNINSCRSMEQIGFKLENQVKRLFPKYNELFWKTIMYYLKRTGLDKRLWLKK
ncbi:GNAT family protein [Bacillus cereus]